MFAGYAEEAEELYPGVSVRDGHTRRVLGRVIADHLRADLVQDTLRQAVALRGELPGKVICHADRGCQYTSQQIADLAGELDLLRSIDRTGVCWDNAAAESFWSTFKNEYYHRHVFATIDDARCGVNTWIDAWYNARRRHSKIGYISPLQHEARLANQATQTAPQPPDQTNHLSENRGQPHAQLGPVPARTPLNHKVY